MKNYPTMLYLGGDRDSEYLIVADEAEEKEKRAKGYRSLRDAPEPKESKSEPAKLVESDNKRGPVRPPKAR